MKIAIFQMNPSVGGIMENTEKILKFSKKAYEMDADLMIAPELAICGYPPKDLLFIKNFILQINNGLSVIAKKTSIPIILGAPIEIHKNNNYFLLNSAVYCYNSIVKVIANKTLLPNYNVFDEKRYFTSNKKNKLNNTIEIKNIIFGITICEDAWNNADDELRNKIHEEDPISEVINNGANIILNLSASPFSAGKIEIRKKIFKNIAIKNQISVIICGQVGANDHLIFDGSSMSINKKGVIIQASKAFEENLSIVNINLKYEIEHPEGKKYQIKRKKDINLIKKALICGINNYFHKCRIKGFILGLSGGLDSSLVASLTAQAIGSKNILGLILPSKFSSSESLLDAKKLACNLGISTITIPIENHVDTFRKTIKLLDFKVKNYFKDICDQNLQARVRSNILMAIANLNDYVLLGTSNKSELSIGYTTIYGDMCGAIAPIGDLYKTEAYLLAEEINKKKALIPINILKKNPSAELKYNQTDQDSLPEYSILDKILKLYINFDISCEEISKKLNIKLLKVKKIIKMVNLSEHKRRQAPICFMVSERTFEVSRKIPIANLYNYKL